MVFAVNGMVRWKKKKLANGIDGRFETYDERIITRLQTLGFKEYIERPIEQPKEVVVAKSVDSNSETKAVQPEPVAVQPKPETPRKSVYRRKERK